MNANCKKVSFGCELTWNKTVFRWKEGGICLTNRTKDKFTTLFSQKQVETEAPNELAAICSCQAQTHSIVYSESFWGQKTESCRNTFVPNLMMTPQQHWWTYVCIWEDFNHQSETRQGMKTNNSPKWPWNKNKLSQA